MRKQCVMCGGEFEARNQTYRSCSPECRREWRLRADRERNRVINLTPALLEAKRTRGRAFYHRNIETERLRNRARYRANVEHERAIRRESKRRYREQNPEKARREAALYAKENRGRRREYERRYREERAAALRLVRDLQSKGLEALL